MSNARLKYFSYALHVVLLVGLAWAGILLLTARAALAAPSEEDIDSSAAPAASAPAAPASRTRGATTVPVPRPRDAAAPTVSASDESAAQSGQPETAATGRTARTTFPYTVRSGDSLGSLSNMFGVGVAEIARASHLGDETELKEGEVVRIPNPFLARERELNARIDGLLAEKQALEQKVAGSAAAIDAVRAQVQVGLEESKQQYIRDLHWLSWWRDATLAAGAVALLMFAAMMVALLESWKARSNLRAVAEMNEALRRLDAKYRAVLAKAELRLQELYGRRRRGIQDGQERAKIPEEAEMESLNRQLKEILERHIDRFTATRENVRRARWRDLINGGVGAPVEARSERR